MRTSQTSDGGTNQSNGGTNQTSGGTNQSDGGSNQSNGGGESSAVVDAEDLIEKGIDQHALSHALAKIADGLSNLNRVSTGVMDELIQDGHVEIVVRKTTYSDIFGIFDSIWTTEERAYIIVLDMPDGSQTYLIYSRREPLGAQSGRAYPKPPPDPYYKLEAIRPAEGISLVTAATIEVFDDPADAVRASAAKLAVVEFAANLVPGFGAIDATRQGHYREAALSAMADLASLVSFGAGELYIAGRIGVKSARLAHTFAIGVDSATAGVRMLQAIIAGMNGNVAGAAGNAGEVLLRLIGVKLSAAQLKALKSASVKPPLPPPAAVSRPPYTYRPTYPPHQRGWDKEVELGEIVHLLPDQATIYYADKIGTHGSDVISVNLKTGEVTLWDAKYKGERRPLKPSKTFTITRTRNAAIAEALNILRANTTLLPDIRAIAIQNLENGIVRTRTAGFGKYMNSTLQ